MALIMIAFAMGTVGFIVSSLVVIDRGKAIRGKLGFFCNGRGHQLPSLGSGERRKFFLKSKRKRIRKR